MEDFFKFDDKRIVFKLFLFICIIVFIELIFSIKIIEVFVPSLFVFIILIIATIFTYNEGIHFNYNNGKIVIVKGMMIKTIEMKEVKYFNIEEIYKTKGNIITQKLVDTYDQVNLPSKYVYNKGKVFNIIFYMKKVGNISIYYGWLYRTKSIQRINSQLKQFEKIKENFMRYKKHYTINNY